MKYVYLVLGILAVVLMIFNSTQIDTNAPFKGDSLVAIIGYCSAVVCYTTTFNNASFSKNTTKVKRLIPIVGCINLQLRITLKCSMHWD